METACPGEGRRWVPGMARAICPVCHRSAGAITGDERLMNNMAGWPLRNRLLIRSRKTVPAHTRDSETTSE